MVTGTAGDPHPWAQPLRIVEVTSSRRSPDNARLTATRIPAATGTTTAVCLVVHGGKSLSTEPVSAVSGPVLRMRPIAWALARRLPSVAVYRLQLAVRGWNGTGSTAIRDARWALDQLRAQHPGAPIVLVGHSMGARTCLRVAGDPAVAGVVGLASWLPPDEPVNHIRGVPVRLVHGDSDRVVSEASTRPLVARMTAAGIDVRRTLLAGTGHAMLRHWRRWNSEIVAAVQESLQTTGPAPRRGRR